MELSEYLEVLFRWGWVIVLVTALCAGGAIGLGKLQTPRYTSLVELNVTPARLDLGLSQTVTNLLRNYASGIQSESMARRVIERLALQGWDAANLRSHIKAEAVENEYKIKIEVTDPDPAFAKRVAQATAELLISDVQAFAAKQDPLDRLTATMLNGGAQTATRTWPKNRLLAFLGLGGGLVLGLLAALVLEWSRVELVQSAQEAESWLELPVLGSIPAAVRRGKRPQSGTSDMRRESS
jgi:capsular polysaccharide biosynthesis protein